MISIQGTERKTQKRGLQLSPTQKGQTVLSSGPRLLLLPSHRETSWTTRTLVTPVQKTLSAMNTESLPVAGQGDAQHAPTSPEASGACWPRLAFHFEARQDGLEYQSRGV